MIGIEFDFDIGDIVIGPTGQFNTTTIDDQCVALISVSQVCRITYPYYGAQIGARLINVPYNRTQSILSEAKTMAQKDGASNVVIDLSSGSISFSGNYGKN